MDDQVPSGKCIDEALLKPAPLELIQVSLALSEMHLDFCGKTSKI